MILLSAITRGVPLPIVLSYLRIRLDNLVKVRNRHRRNRIAGFTVHLLNFSDFKYLVKNIFVKREYHFRTGDTSPLIIDCGSNIGISVLYFKYCHPTARIIAFEADATAFGRLEQNIADNRLTATEAHNKAVAGEAGRIDFFMSADQPGDLQMSTRPGRKHATRVKVDAVPLSEYIHEPVACLKLDVEGAEEAVLRDLARADKLRHIERMFIEYHHHIDPGADRLGKCLRLLERAGFGYHLNSCSEPPYPPHRFQDIMIYAYRKRDGAGPASAV